MQKIIHIMTALAATFLLLWGAVSYATTSSNPVQMGYYFAFPAGSNAGAAGDYYPFKKFPAQFTVTGANSKTVGSFSIIISFLNNSNQTYTVSTQLLNENGKNLNSEINKTYPCIPTLDSTAASMAADSTANGIVPNNVPSCKVTFQLTEANLNLTNAKNKAERKIHFKVTQNYPF